MNVRGWTYGLILVLLTACGGGSGNSGPRVTASASPASVVLTASTTDGAPSVRVTVLVEGAITGPYEVVVIGAARGYVTATIDDTGTIRAC